MIYERVMKPINRDVYFLSGAGEKRVFYHLGDAIEELISRHPETVSPAGLKAHLLNRFKRRYAVEYGACAITMLNLPVSDDGEIIGSP